MQGTIRTLVGFLIIAGAVGGIENGTDSQLILQLVIAAVGIALMYSGVSAIKRIQGA